MENLPVGYLSCRSCGSIENCADLVSGLCPVCRRGRAAHLAQLQSDYQEALQAGDPPPLWRSPSSSGTTSSPRASGSRTCQGPTGSPEKGLVRIWPVGGPISVSPLRGSWYIHRPPIVAPGPSCARSGMNLGDFRKGD